MTDTKLSNLPAGATPVGADLFYSVQSGNSVKVTGTQMSSFFGGGGGMAIGGTVTSGTPGSILFVGTGPVLAQDNAAFFWDDTNKRLIVTGSERIMGASLSNPTLNIGLNAGDSSFRFQAGLDATADIPYIAMGAGTTARDVGISRISSGVLGFGNATAGDTSAEIRAAIGTFNGGGTVTSSTPAINVTQTQNGAVQFRGTNYNFTPTAVGQLLPFAYQMNGIDFFTSIWNGSDIQIALTGPGTGSQPRYTIKLNGLDANARIIFGLDSSDFPFFAMGPGGVTFRDTYLRRADAGIFSQSNTTNAQGFRIYNTTDSDTAPVNSEYGKIDWQGIPNAFTIGTVATGTGTARNLNLASASNTIYLYSGFGHISNVFTTQHGVEYGFGGTQGNTPNFTVFADGSVPWVLGTTTTSAPFSITQTWNNGATTFETFNINVTQTAAGINSNLMDLQIGGKSQFVVSNINTSMTNASVFIGTNVDPNFQGAGSPSQEVSVSDGFVTWGMSLLGINNQAFAHGLTQAKTRGTLSTPGAVTEGDQVAAQYYLADDGTGISGNMPNVARHYCLIDGAVGTNITPGRFTWNTSDHGSSDARFQERMRLDANGLLVFNGNLGQIGGYTQLQQFGATTCTITIASPAVITLTNHGFLPNQAVQFSTTGSLPTGITAGTTYFVSKSGLTQNTFEIDTLPNSTSGFGGVITTTGTQSGTQSVAAVITGNNHASGTGRWGLSGINQLVSDQALKLTQNWNLPIVSTTGASGTGSIATLNFAALTAAPTVGATIFVNGVTPAGYNGTYVVTASTSTSVSYANTTTGAQTVSGAIQLVPTMFIANVNQIAGFNGAIADFQTNGVSNFTVQAGSANTILSNGTNGVNLRVYNTVDVPLVPTNYERGVFDWTTTANVLTIGTQAGGTGTARAVALVSAVANSVIGIGGSGSGHPAIRDDGSGTLGIVLADNSAYTGLRSQSFYSGSSITVTTDLYLSSNTSRLQVGANGNPALSRGAVDGVLAIGLGAAGNTGGWFNYGGQARVTSDFSVTSSTTLTNITGLSVSVQAGRTYQFTAELSYTDAAAGGVQAAISGTCTATNIIYDGWILDNGANGIKGNTQATALGTAVASAVTTGTAGHITLIGTITVNAAGTLTVQFAQNTSNGTSSVVKRGSTFIVQDMP